MTPKQNPLDWIRRCRATDIARDSRDFCDLKTTLFFGHTIHIRMELNCSVSQTFIFGTECFVETLSRCTSRTDALSINKSKWIFYGKINVKICIWSIFKCAAMWRWTHAHYRNRSLWVFLHANIGNLASGTAMHYSDTQWKQKTTHTNTHARAVFSVFTRMCIQNRSAADDFERKTSLLASFHACGIMSLRCRTCPCLEQVRWDT